MLSPSKLVIRLAVALVLLAAVMAVSLLIGSQSISLSKALQGPQIDEAANIDYIILMHERLPRVCLASLIGAALACSGVIFQAILRNPTGYEAARH